MKRYGARSNFGPPDASCVNIWSNCADVLALLWQNEDLLTELGEVLRSVSHLRSQRVANWNGDLLLWLEPFLARLGHKARRRMCPLYVAGLIGPGDRKSVDPMAERMAPGDYDQLHHFVAGGVWDETPLEQELANQADKLVGGANAVLVVDDTALPKKGMHSVGVAPQYASALGKTANCQTLVSLTLARGEVPVMVGLRLFLPESWTGDQARLAKAGVPANMVRAAGQVGDRAGRTGSSDRRRRSLRGGAG